MVTLSIFNESPKLTAAASPILAESRLRFTRIALLRRVSALESPASLGDKLAGPALTEP